MGKGQFAINLGQPLDVSLPIAPLKKPTESKSAEKPTETARSLDAFYIPGAVTSPLTAGSWVGDLEQGSSVNCWNLHFCAHGSGTHTECMAHVVVRAYVAA